MYFCTIVVVLLSCFSCEKDEPQFASVDPTLHKAVAFSPTGERYDFYRVTHTEGSQNRNGMPRFIFRLPQADYETYGIEQHIISLRVVFDSTTDIHCYDEIISNPERNINLTIANAYGALNFSDYGVGFMDLDDNFPNELCITEILNDGHDLVGTFQMQWIKRENGDPFPSAPWPDTLTLLNGEFRSTWTY